MTVYAYCIFKDMSLAQLSTSLFIVIIIIVIIIIIIISQMNCQ